MWAVWWCGKCQLSPKTQVKPTDGWFCYKQDQSPYCVWWAWVEAGSTESSHEAQGLSEGLSTSQTGRSFIPFTSSQSSSRCAASSVLEDDTAGGRSGKCPESKYPWNRTSGPYPRTRRAPLRITDPDSTHRFEANPWQAVSSSERAPQGCCDVPTFRCWEAPTTSGWASRPTSPVQCSSLPSSSEVLRRFGLRTPRCFFCAGYNCRYLPCLKIKLEEDLNIYVFKHFRK